MATIAENEIDHALAAKITEAQASVEQALNDASYSKAEAIREALNEADAALQRAYLLAEFGSDD